MQAQLQTLTGVVEGAGTVAVVSQPNIEFNVEVAKLQTFDSIQVVYKNKNERASSRRTNSVGIVICAGKVSRYMERECLKEFRDRNVGVYNSESFWQI